MNPANINMADGEKSNAHIAWHRQKLGPYMPTPVIYRGSVYSLQNQGILTCYDLRTGDKKFRKRIPHAGAGFSASPVAADGKVFLLSEDGDVFVVRAADEFEIVATNPMGEVLMASPALSDGTLYIRGEHHLFAVGR